MYTAVFTVLWMNLITGVLPDNVTTFFGGVNTKLTFDVLKLQQENMVVSTLSLRFLLCKLASVANGNTKAELTTALGITDSKAINTCYSSLKEQLDMIKGIDLILFNKLYINYTDYVDSNFVTNSLQNFGVYVEKMSFDYGMAAVSFINKWAETSTYRRVTDVLSRNDVDRLTSILAISIAHMKMTWEFPFDIRLTKPHPFRLLNNKVVYVPMMTKYDEVLFYDDSDLGIQMISIHLGGMGWSVTFVVPSATSKLPHIIDQLSKNPDIIKRNKKKMKFTFMKLNLPKLRIKTLINWNKHLKLIGVNQVFNTSSPGLDAISTDTSKVNHYLSKAIQKIFLEVDETGPYRQLLVSSCELAPASTHPLLLVDICRRCFCCLCLSSRGRLYTCSPSGIEYACNRHRCCLDCCCLLWPCPQSLDLHTTIIVPITVMRNG